MSSDENCPSTSDSPIMERTESSTQASASPTILIMTSDSNSSPSPEQLPKKKLSTEDCSQFHYVSTKKQTAAKEISISYLRHRLCIREFFIARLTLVSNIMCFLAISGIALMIIENELTFRRIDNKDTKASWSIKLIISVTTVILLALIFYYHYLDITLYAFRNLLEDRRVLLTTPKILLIVTEVLICAIHPMPRSYPYIEPERINSNPLASNLSSLNSYSLSYTAVDVGLGLPMFLRLYLFGRSMMLYSHVTRNLTLRSSAYLNHVSTNIYFIIRAYLEHWPTRCLSTSCTLVFLIGSWSLRACDYRTTGEHLSMSDSMWLFVITFTTVGYGDIYPSTYCGRSVAAIIGLLGLLLSALLIAILTKKLLLTREEKYVHTFVSNTRLTKKYKNHAANVIKFAMKIWYLKRHNKSKSIEYFRIERKLFCFIRHLQKTKKAQRNLADSCLGFTELMSVQRGTSAKTEETVEQIAAIKTEMKQMREELNNISRNMNNLQKTLTVFLEKVTK